MTHCVPTPAVIHTVTQYVPTGVTYVHAIISSIVSFVVGGGLGYYIRGRGIQGVKIDAENVAKEASTISTEAVTEVKAL